MLSCVLLSAQTYPGNNTSQLIRTAIYFMLFRIPVIFRVFNDVVADFVMTVHANECICVSIIIIVILVFFRRTTPLFPQQVYAL